MNAKGLAHRLGECAAMGSVRGYWDAEKAESIIAEALAEQDKEIARLRDAITTFAKGQAWAVQGWKDQPHIKPLFEIAALLPPAEKEEP